MMEGQDLETSTFLLSGDERRYAAKTARSRGRYFQLLAVAIVSSAAILVLSLMVSTNKYSITVTNHSVSNDNTISEYDLIRTFSTHYDDADPFHPPYDPNDPRRTKLRSDVIVSTPLPFETAVRAMGITDDEYAACGSSIYQDPDRKICTRLGELVCYMKANENDMPIKIQCPSLYDENNIRWDSTCYKDRSARDAQPSLCYITAPCLEQAPQWNATNVEVVAGQNLKWHSVNPGWNGGLMATKPIIGTNITNMADFYAAFRQTDPYQGKLCLQKAALKALSRNGWELTDPSTAFTSEYWTVIKKTPI